MLQVSHTARHDALNPLWVPACVSFEMSLRLAPQKASSYGGGEEKITLYSRLRRGEGGRQMKGRKAAPKEEKNEAKTRSKKGEGFPFPSFFLAA